MSKEPGAVGPEFGESGDPAWGEAPLRDRGAYSEIDIYTGWGRWKERIYPSDPHAADSNPFALGRFGLQMASMRLHQALRPPEESAGEVDAKDLHHRRTTAAIVAVYDALEWVHSLHDHLIESGRYKRPADVDATYGPYVEGVIGARNASHHGLRRVVGFIDVARPIYAAKGTRWVHTGTYADRDPDRQLRWVETLPVRSETGADKTQALRYASQSSAFEQHLAGREVRNTFAAVNAFYFYALDGKEPPADHFFGPMINLPPIDPQSLKEQD